MYIKLSYNLSEETPLPPGASPVKIKQLSKMETGDVSNVYSIEAMNHSGTHIDAPKHFSPGGKRIAEIDISKFFFSSPLCLDVLKKDSELIRSCEMEPYRSRIAKADILLLRTGFAKYRQKDKERYCYRNPGLSVDASRYLIDNFGKLRAIGIDTISFAANEHIEEGIEAHKVLLSNPKQFFLLIEDLNLEFEADRIKRVIALPLFVEGIDSSFCTVVAEI